MDENGLSLTQALKAAELAKSSWYYRSRPRPPRPLNPKLVAAIETAWTGSRGVYGYRKIYKTLRAGGLRVNKKAVLRHRSNGVRSCNATFQDDGGVNGPTTQN
ncbi:MAG: transposase [Elusimicrobia bacterium]|nr:transposase [Elusimicrobiota bacterium]